MCVLSVYFIPLGGLHTFADLARMAQSRHGLPSQEAGSEKSLGPADHPKVPQSRTWMAEDSDFFPSVALAVVLFLVFISVLPVLFQPNKAYLPLLRQMSTVKERTLQFHPFLYGQPLSTQQAVERLHKDVEAGAVVVAVAGEDAHRTLECFSINVMALLSSHQGQVWSFIKRVGEHKHPEATWNKNSTQLPKTYSVAVITLTKGHISQGIILGPPGTLRLMEVNFPRSPPSELNELLSLASNFLHQLHKTGHISETYKATTPRRRRLAVIRITADPHLESGMVC
ncbi:uncharacterized protein [Hyperolius riggenbachi]|uniref:uncharacterized protein n=1 Tax=Hyperolius riggenbachi TaxID=752182 RepID=UPI0035A303A0